MTTAIEYALLAGAAYYDNRAEIHRFPLPKDWSVLSRLPEDKLTGFEVSTFIKGTPENTQIVISFAGTDFSQPGTDFYHGNIPNFLGTVADQVKQAAKYYLQMKALYPAPGQITLTGHSLGGCLASLIGVFFGETTFTFDQAPGRAVALTGATTLRDYLLGEGYSNTALSALNTFIANQTGTIGDRPRFMVSSCSVPACSPMRKSCSGCGRWWSICCHRSGRPGMRRGASGRRWGALSIK